MFIWFHVPMGRFGIEFYHDFINKALGEAIEQAYAALFLASDESSYITGTDFAVDGGLTSSYVTPEGKTTTLSPHSNFSGV